MNRDAKPPEKRATIKDVARAAGVSPGTVSNALSGKRKVDSQTQARITAAIEALGYTPNLAARGMRTGRAGTIAIFSSMPTAVAAGQSRLGFLMEIAASAAVTAMERNVALLLVPPIEDPAAALSTIAFDGAILVEPDAQDRYMQLLSARGVPTVVIGPTGDVPGRAVTLDYALMARLLFDHLHESGARDFPLIIGESGRASNVVFREVYEARCAARGLVPRVIAVPEAAAEAGAREAMLGAIGSGARLDGALVPIDAMATGVMAALRQAGLAVPEQVRVATRYDGLRARSESPALTALNLHLDAVADLATGVLVDLLDDVPGEPVLAAPRPELVARGSTIKA
ncbi:substrate-binding domain-containing protein [Salipiger sp. PrR002]|uniref:substrate-binding domain-containing protein n=1 Tax=Salipiger sp. PrR002 TaxID=2706489 RepID=UPI0013BD0246|nr:substrate-binding domain-containing protein [Salipiger sp. PrR002]NDW00023.1 substrate-binding domain-containing protein [Salipiger sp. PrR002]NDW56185.1 substrate-binding domain-containing protein [Salipiger sp. PrR004]